jgi:carbon storage regulator
MLVVSRKMNEEIVIEGEIHIKVLEIHGARVRLGVQAPKALRVDRHEVHNRRAEFAAKPAKSLRTPGCGFRAAEEASFQNP